MNIFNRISLAFSVCIWVLFLKLLATKVTKQTGQLWTQHTQAVLLDCPFLSWTLVLLRTFFYEDPQYLVLLTSLWKKDKEFALMIAHFQWQLRIYSSSLPEPVTPLGTKASVPCSQLFARATAQVTATF